MTNYNNSATLVWPATFPGSEDVLDPHVTCTYMGDKQEIKATPQEFQQTLGFLGWQPDSPKVTGVEVFGRFGVSDLSIVATLEVGALSVLKTLVNTELEHSLGVKDASSYPDYRPHVTLGSIYEGVKVVPTEIELGRLQLWWGDERYDI